MRDKQTTLGIRLSQDAGVRSSLRAIGLMAWLAYGWTLSTTNPLNAQSLTWLGTIGHPMSTARGVSDDGSAVTGWFTQADGKNFAFRWTPSTGMQNSAHSPNTTPVRHMVSLAMGTESWGSRFT